MTTTPTSTAAGTPNSTVGAAAAATTGGPSPAASASRPPTLPAGYGYEWVRFTDWCAAACRAPLPADPVTVAEFLDDHPAPPGTQRRRLAAITAIHTAAGQPSPARAATIRALLRPTSAAGDAAAAAARSVRLQQVTDVLTRLPSTGWPLGLFGRRDALLLLLTHHARLGPTAAVRLRRGDLSTTPDRQLRITTGPFDLVLLPSTPDTRTCPACIHRRWADVLTSTDADQTRRTLRTALHTATPPGANSAHPCAHPAPAWTADTSRHRLLTAIDGWGWLPWEGTGLTPKASAGIVTAHLTGVPPTHRTLRVPVPPGTDPAADASAPPPPPSASASTAADRAQQAAAALLRRRTDVQALTAASDTLTGLDTRLQELLQRTLDLLEGTATPGSAHSRGVPEPTDPIPD